MGHKIGQSNGKQEGTSPLLWLVVGGAAGVGLYFLGKELLRPKGSVTDVMPLPPVAPPSRFVNFDSVKARYDQVRDLFHMGPTYKSGPEAISELSALQTAARNFKDAGQVNAATADALIADMEDFKAKIVDFLQFQESLKPQPAIAVSGRIRRR